MFKKLKSRCGSATIEAIISFSAFLVTFFTILGVINVCRAEMLISNAVDTSAKEISEYSYFYKMSGLQKISNAVQGNAEVGANNVNEIIGTVDDLYTSLTTTANDGKETANLVKTNVENAVNTGDLDTASIQLAISGLNNDVTSIQTSMKEVESAFTAVTTNPLVYMKSIACIAGNEALEVAKSRLIAAPLAKCFTQKHFGDTKKEANIFLENIGVVDGFDGLNFNMSTIFSKDEPEDIHIKVYYKVRVFQPLKWWDLQVAFCKEARARAWLGGDNIQSKVTPAPTPTQKPEEKPTEEATKDEATKEEKSIEKIREELIALYPDKVEEIDALIALYGDDAAKAIYYGGPDSFEFINNYGKDGIFVILVNDSKSQELIKAINNSNGYQKNIIECVKNYGQDGVDAIIIGGDDAAVIMSTYGEDSAKAIAKNGAASIEIIYKYETSGIKALNDGVPTGVIDKFTSLRTEERKNKKETDEDKKKKDQEEKEFVETLSKYAKESVKNGACKSEEEFYKMYKSRSYSYSQEFIDKIKAPYLSSGASAVVNQDDVINAFIDYNSVGYPTGNFTTSCKEDSELLYDSNGNLKSATDIAKIKGVNSNKYEKGAYQYVYDSQLVNSFNDKGKLNMVDGTSGGASAINIPGAHTWAGDNTNYSESELLMPQIDLFKYAEIYRDKNKLESVDDAKIKLLEELDKNGKIVIKNPPIFNSDNVFEGTFTIQKMG